MTVAFTDPVPELTFPFGYIAEFFQFIALEHSTRSTYESKLRTFLRFCKRFGIHPLQLREVHLILYVSFRATKPVQHSTIRGDLAAIASFHTDWNRPLRLIGFSTLQRVLRGIKKYQGLHKNPRLPITIAVLTEFLTLLQPSDNLAILVFRAAFTIAVFGLLRCGEFAYDSSQPIAKLLRMSSVLFHPNARNPRYITIRLRVSKSDIFRMGVDIAIPCICPSFRHMCPVHELLCMLRLRQAAGLPCHDDDPLFLFGDRKTLSRKHVTDMLNRLSACIKSTGQERYKGHSFRRGGATTLAQGNCPSWAIQVLGRWQGDCYVRYIELPPSEICHYVRFMLQS